MKIQTFKKSVLFIGLSIALVAVIAITPIRWQAQVVHATQTTVYTYEEGA